MATTKKLLDIDAKIAELQREKAEIVAAEKTAIIAEMKENIATYGITAAELGFGGAPAKAASKSSAVKTKAPVMYKNGDKTWSGGRGPRPKWVKELEAAGGNIEDYKI